MPPRARFDHIAELVDATADVPGDLMEIGVWYGFTFLPLALRAGTRLRKAHAVDSFAGMAEPTPLDREPDGSCRFPAGVLAADRAALESAIRPIAADCRIWQGFVPEVLDRISLPAGLAFAHLDLDQYAPTRAALAWTWPRLNPGGIVAVHDYIPGQRRLATAGVDDAARQLRIAPAGRNESSGHVWFRRPKA